MWIMQLLARTCQMFSLYFLHPLHLNKSPTKSEIRQALVAFSFLFSVWVRVKNLKLVSVSIVIDYIKDTSYLWLSQWGFRVGYQLSPRSSMSVTINPILPLTLEQTAGNNASRFTMKVIFRGKKLHVALDEISLHDTYKSLEYIPKVCREFAKVWGDNLIQNTMLVWHRLYIWWMKYGRKTESVHSAEQTAVGGTQD